MHLKSAVAVALTSSSQLANQSTYAPQYTACPSSLSIRPAGGLSSQEQAWKQKRMTNVIDALKTYLPRANISGFDESTFLSLLTPENAPVSALVVSGGGTTSGMGGLGVWQAFDERNNASVQAGTGGLTQTFTYLSGLSGGGFLSTASLAANNFGSIDSIRQAINFSVNYVTGPDDNPQEYFGQLFENAAAKAELGFPVTVADIFGQFFGTYLPSNETYSTWSSFALRNDTAFAQGKGPMPIVSMAEILPDSPSYMGVQFPGRNNFNLTLYEATPYEFGNWAGGRVQAYMPTEYLGSTMSQGQPANTSECVTGFDRTMFIQGSTADAFDGYFISELSNGSQSVFAKRDIIIPPYAENSSFVQLVEAVAQNFNQSLNASLWATYPNPFLNYNQAMQGDEELYLVDGSETGQTIAFWPVLNPDRKVDFIVAVDGSTDFTFNWVNGTEMVDTSIVTKQGNVTFPSMPDQQTFVDYQLNLYPTFFGCESDYDGPIVLYLPNAPWSGYTNYSYTKPSFTDNQVDLALQNWFNIATYGNGHLDAEWPACVACALVKRSAARVNVTLPDACEQCFTRHCWNGTMSTATSSSSAYDPSLVLGGPGFAAWNGSLWYGTE